MRYETPQFMEVEAKIIGPLTVKQFGWLAAAFVIDLVLLMAFERFVLFVVGIPVTALAAAFAFIRFNGRPLIFTVMKAVSFAFKPKLYVWKKKEE